MDDDDDDSHHHHHTTCIQPSSYNINDTINKFTFNDCHVELNYTNNDNGIQDNETDGDDETEEEFSDGDDEKDNFDNGGDWEDDYGNYGGDLDDCDDDDDYHNNNDDNYNDGDSCETNDADDQTSYGNNSDDHDYEESDALEIVKSITTTFKFIKNFKTFFHPPTSYTSSLFPFATLKFSSSHASSFILNVQHPTNKCVIVRLTTYYTKKNSYTMQHFPTWVGRGTTAQYHIMWCGTFLNGHSCFPFFFFRFLFAFLFLFYHFFFSLFFFVRFL